MTFETSDRERVNVNVVGCNNVIKHYKLQGT